MIFDSTATYISTDELSMAVDAAVKLERPLLVKGEPGTGKTLLAEEVANSLGMELVQWHIKSTTKAQQSCTNTTQSPGCAIRNSATSASKTSATTSRRQALARLRIG
jgi:Cdc6-like AAA superfamily ATPase